MPVPHEAEMGPFLGLVKDRLGTVYNEFGGVLDIKYSDADCTTSDLPTPQTNRRRCFPTYWTKTDGESENPTLDWFHKYVVTETVQTDLTDARRASRLESPRAKPHSQGGRGGCPHNQHG